MIKDIAKKEKSELTFKDKIYINIAVSVDKNKAVNLLYHDRISNCSLLITNFFVKQKTKGRYKTFLPFAMLSANLFLNLS